MTTGPHRPTDPNQALDRLAERGTPRGADAVYAAAHADRDVLPWPADAPSHRGRTLAAAAVVAALVGGAGVALTVGRDHDGRQAPGTIPDTPFCNALTRTSTANPDGWNLAVYLDPGLDATARDGIGAALRADARVGSLRYVDAAASYAEFRRLFADRPDMVATVRPEQLPTSFRLEAEPSDLTALVAEYRTRPGVYETRVNALTGRAVDILVRTGEDRSFVVPPPVEDRSTPSGLTVLLRGIEPVAPDAVRPAVHRLVAESIRRQVTFRGSPAAGQALPADARALTDAARRECHVTPAPDAVFPTPTTPEAGRVTTTTGR